MDVVRAEIRSLRACDRAPVALADEAAGVRVHRFEVEPEALGPRQGAVMDVGDASRARVGV